MSIFSNSSSGICKSLECFYFVLIILKGAINSAMCLATLKFCTCKALNGLLLEYLNELIACWLLFATIIFLK